MNSYRTSNAQESSINLSQDEQCKQIIKVINQSNTRIFNSPPPVPNIPPFLIGLSDEEQQAQEQARAQAQAKRKQQDEQFVAILNARIENVQAVQLDDLQLKNLQTQLVQAYQKHRQAQITLYFPPLESSSQIEPSTNPPPEGLQAELESDLQQMERDREKMNQRSQQWVDANRQVHTANSSLNKYCGLE